MKVNKTPIDEKGNKVKMHFPPADIIEGIEQNEENLQTFELITYEKENQSQQSFTKSIKLCK